MSDLPLPPEAFNLVQLSTLPESEWRGRAVFHPREQRGTEAFWKATAEDWADALADGHDAPDPDVAYDVGVVLDWEPDPDFPEYIRVRFMTGFGTSLRYGSWNLWVVHPG